MDASHSTIAEYYDAHVMGKLRGFVEGNARVECAWQTIDRWSPTHPKRVLEIGCGIGDISWRMSQQWHEAVVVGLDISPQSLEIAKKLFNTDNLSFLQGHLAQNAIDGEFNLIVLMDVYEHVAVSERPALHESLKKLRSHQDSRIILSFPTPRHLGWLRKHHPEQIQPIDEDICLDTLLALATHTKTELLLYQEVDIWHKGDYAHAVLGKRGDWEAAVPFSTSQTGLRRIIHSLRRGRKKSFMSERSKRLALVHQRLSLAAYPN